MGEEIKKSNAKIYGGIMRDFSDLTKQGLFQAKQGAPFGFQEIKLYTRWWFHRFFLFTPKILGK